MQSSGDERCEECGSSDVVAHFGGTNQPMCAECHDKRVRRVQRHRRHRPAQPAREGGAGVDATVPQSG